MLPIALLPAAGILLGIGGAFTNETMIQAYGLEEVLGKGTVANSILYLMKYTGEVIFANLPLMFAAAIPIGLAKVEKGTAALAGVVGFLVMHQTINGILYIQGITPESASLKALLELGMPETAATAKSQEYTSVLGIFSLQMSVMGGLIAGFVAVFLHNRFHNIQLPTFLAFFWGHKICANCNYNGNVCGRNIFNIYLAFYPRCNDFVWKNCRTIRTFWNICIWSNKKIFNSIWTSPHILFAILANSCWGNIGNK